MARTPRLHDMPTLRRVFLGALIGVATGLVLLGLRSTEVFENVELGFVDARTRHFLANRPPDARIVLAEILEADVSRVKASWAYTWPWELELNAMAFDLMREAGARAIAVDMFHLDKGAALEDLPPEHALFSERDEQYLVHQKEQAQLLGGAFARHGGVTLAFELAEEPRYELEGRLAAVRPKLDLPWLANSPPGIQHVGANLPVSNVARGCRLLGFANVKPDLDGVVRRAPTTGRWRDRAVPSLALATAAVATNGEIRFADGGVYVGEAYQSLMDDGSFLVNFRGDAGTPYGRVSPADMLAWAAEREETGEVPEAAQRALDGRFVIWGLNISGNEDIVTTPLSGEYHGPEYQAHMLDNLLHGDGRVRAPPWANALVLFSITVFLGAAAGAMRTRLLPHLVPLFTALVVVVAAYVVFQRGTSIDLFTPLLGVLLTWGGTSIARVLTEGRRNRWLEGTFGRYLAPSIIEALKRDPGLLELGGRRKEITILFSDVANFTKISEQLQASQVVELLNRYLTAHSAAVMEEGGVVDKFMGDGVLAFFGDPIPTPDHALRACKAALSVTQRVPLLHEVWESFGLKDFHARIGLNTGTAVVGNMGSAQRFDYTCMGDAVNLASRLEGANKVFGSTILIGSQTFEDAKAQIVARPIAAIVVVGRGVAEPVYELLGLRDDAPEELVRLVEAYGRAHAAVRAGDLSAARTALAQADEIRPGDGPTRWLRGLVDRMERGEEPVPWNGRVELTGK